MKVSPALLLRSISLLRTCARGLQLRSQSPPFISKVLVTIFFVPLLTLLGVLLRIYTTRIGPFRAEVVTQWGARWTCSLPDNIQFWIYLLGIWEPDITAFVRRRLSPGDMFIDVGAHVGYYTVLASGLVGESGRVAAVEASPRNFGVLTANLALENRGRNVRAVNMAASSKRGTIDLYGGLPWGSDLTTTLASRGFPVEAQVQAAPLDEILTPQEVRSARLIKVDVEGSELEVFAGMTDLLTACRPDAEFIVELSPVWWPGEDKRLSRALQPFFKAGFFAYRIDNFYRPWRYLWSASIRRPRRMRGESGSSPKHIDLVLSRQDAGEL